MISRRSLLCAAAAAPLIAAPDTTIHLKLRRRLQTPTGSWDLSETTEALPARKLAIVICDMWDNHWCSAAAKRCSAMAPRMNSVVESARAQGVRIFHAPSDTMEFYASAPQRRRIQAFEKIDPPAPRQIDAPPLPIDDTDGGCDSDEKTYKAWTRQHPAIKIAGEDYISDKGPEIYSALKHEGIERLLVMGVHTNMCILNRTFAIKQMTRWGVNCALVRDLTDAMYDPKDKPFVSHDRGTELVVEHIEKYWCPSTLSKHLLTT